MSESDAKTEDGSQRKISWRDRITHFTWPWFAVTMSTGAVSVILSQTPYRFDGLDVIGKIFFILDLVLFVAFNFMILMRFILVPYQFLASLHHPTESLFFGAYWVSASLILDGMQAYGVPSTGPWLVTAIRVLFWMYCGTVLLVGVFQYYILFQEERLQVNNAIPAWIFPIYPTLVIGPMAATIIPSQPPAQGYDMWVAAVTFQGLGWTVSILQYAIYMQRLMSSKLPAPPTRPGMYVSVGPAGYTSAALVALGNVAPSVLPADVFGSTNGSPGDVVRIIGIVCGIFVFLFSFWFFAISTVAVLSGARKMSFTLNWWAFIFPNAGLTLAAIQIGKALNSDGINGVCAAFTILLVIFWLMTAAFHVHAVYYGKIMFPGKDENEDMFTARWGRWGLRNLDKPQD